MVDAHVVSREELIKRTWYNGTYLKGCGNYYDQEEAPKKVAPKQSPSFSKSVIEAAAVTEATEVKPEDKKENKMNMSFLMEKRKEFNRNRFLKNL